MNLRILSLIAGTMLCSLRVTPAQNITINFDDLPSPGTSFAAIPNGYKGLQWSNTLEYFDPATNQEFGFNTGASSPPNAAIITDQFSGIASNRPFTFISFYVTSVSGGVPLTLTVTGLKGGTTLYTQNIEYSGNTPTLFTLNFSDITQIVFDANFFTALDDLHVDLSSAFALTPGLNPNQIAVAGNVDLNNNASTPKLTPLITALNNLSTAALPAAFDQLSPLPFGQFASTTAINNASFETEAQDNYTAGLRSGPNGTFLGGNGGIDVNGLTLNDPSYDPALALVHSRLLAWNPAPQAATVSDVANPVLGGVELRDSKEMKPLAPAYTDPWNFYVRGNVILAQGFSEPNVAHFDDNTASVVLGTDYRLNPNFLIGITAGYGHTDVTLDPNGSSATVDSYSPGLYASYANQGWYANASGNYTHNAYTQSRVIGFLGQTANSAPEGNEGVANLDGGYEFHEGALTFGPLAGLQYTHLTLDGYHENGSVADLNVDSQDTDSLRSRLGGRVNFKFTQYGLHVMPHLDASWQHEFFNQSRGITSQFNGGLGSFEVQTSNPSRDSALVDAGIKVELNQKATLFTDYMVQAGQDNYFGQSISGGVKIGF